MPGRGLSQEPISAMEAAIAYADAMAANADQWTLKRVKKLPNQLRAGAEKVARWKELELTKYMVGKARLPAYFWVWRLKNYTMWLEDANDKRLEENDVGPPTSPRSPCRCRSSSSETAR